MKPLHYVSKPLLKWPFPPHIFSASLGRCTCMICGGWWVEKKRRSVSVCAIHVGGKQAYEAASLRVKAPPEVAFSSPHFFCLLGEVYMHDMWWMVGREKKEKCECVCHTCRWQTGI
eukprot:TRINITY_DN3205_c0_g1_i2.p2 TRINITY_DN3205_c0_g1~~TRINITY_DN3205_c0_g1_i2.p2  ORF type:complete len:116 (-),score=0.24 TRINITY_DN3205_c0_g1_i2:136-483(-)